MARDQHKMNQHMQPLSKQSLQVIRHTCIFIAAFLINLPIARAGEGLLIPPLRSCSEVAKTDPVELQELVDLIDKLRPLTELRESVYKDVTEYAADAVSREDCMGWDSDEDISQQMGNLEVKDDVEDKEIDEAMHFFMESTTTYTPEWCGDITNYSRTKSRDYFYSKNKNYVSAEDDVSSKQLAKDAKLIHESIRGDKSFTTIFCVALRDRHGHIKKFPCCNSELMHQDGRKQAESSGYAVIQAEQAHAECQFLQFLYKRALINPGLYTHVVAMGCSKRHCPECDFVLQLVLGSNYKDISAVIGSTTEDITQLEIQPEAKNDDFTITRNASIHCTIQSGEAAARSKLSDNFYMPDGLRALIEQKIKPGYKIRVVGNSRYSKRKKRR